MGTRMLLFPGEEHLHRAPSWGGMHDPDVGNPSSWNISPYTSHHQSGGGGNTWSKRLAASNNDSDSWEVRAFAEDASTSGQWPPRSYSCSFCQREFRTAQALGGHMNVHRRERAQANQLAQLRSTGTEAHNNNNVQDNTNHWLTRTHSSSELTVPDHYNNSRASLYDGHRHAPEDHNSGYSAAASDGTPSFRNYDPAAWRSPYDTSTMMPARDSGLDLELRLGQRYD